MKRGRILKASLRIGLLTCCLWSFAAAQSINTTRLAQEYQAAVANAAFPKSGDNFDHLVVVDTNNPGLVWRNNASEVLVVTWKSFDDYTKYYKDQRSTSPGEDHLTWVTTAPEVQEFCRKYFKNSNDPAALDLRLKEFLGLSPDWKYDGFIEMWVRPGDLFRPCPNPDIHASQCKLDLSSPSPQVHNIKDYNSFFINLYFKSFRHDPTAPWTGLGYTYDWGNSESKRGASEFILVPKARYDIKQYLPTATYCS